MTHLISELKKAHEVAEKRLSALKTAYSQKLHEGGDFDRDWARYVLALESDVARAVYERRELVERFLKEDLHKPVRGPEAFDTTDRWLKAILKHRDEPSEAS
ncbi:MAG: hypothetical protein AAF627_08340 [Myxococcota bacterium]